MALTPLITPLTNDPAAAVSLALWGPCQLVGLVRELTVWLAISNSPLAAVRAALDISV
jgi:hypothetical protein